MSLIRCKLMEVVSPTEDRELTTFECATAPGGVITFGGSIFSVVGYRWVIEQAGAEAWLNVGVQRLEHNHPPAVKPVQRPTLVMTDASGSPKG